MGMGMGMGTGPGRRVADMDLERVVVLPQDTRLLEAAQSMLRTGASAVVIGAGDSILTDHDLVRAMAQGRSSLAPALSEVSSGGDIISWSSTAADAFAAMMRSDATQLVVVDEIGEPIGTISLLDVLMAVVGEGGVSAWMAAVGSSVHEQRGNRSASLHGDHIRPNRGLVTVPAARPRGERPVVLEAQR